ncbi:MAG: hypothetical protein QM778_27670 [Myxococcales bacterium]
MSLRNSMRCLALLLSCAGVVACSDDPNQDSELPDAVVVQVGKGGGVVQANGVSLEIPEGALDKDVMISAKKIDTDKVSLPDSAKDVVSDVYEFGPKGTKFMKDVTVKIDTDKATSGAKMFFTKEGSDTDFEKLASANDGKQVSAKTNHFSLGFVGVPADDVAVMDAGHDAGPIDPGTGDGGLDAGDDDASTGAPDAGAKLDAGVTLPDGGTTSDSGVTPLPKVTVRSYDFYGTPTSQTWAAFQDGDGAWQVITAESAGIYRFDIKGERYSFVAVCDGEQPRQQIIHAGKTTATLTIEAQGDCAPLPITVARSGNILAPASVTNGEVRFGHRWFADVSPFADPEYAYSIPGFIPGKTTDLVVGLHDGSNFVKVNVLRDVTLAGDESGIDLNFFDAGAAPEFGTLQVGDLGAEHIISAQYTVSGASAGMDVLGTVEFDGKNATAPVTSLPAGLKDPSDRIRYYVMDTVSGGYRDLTLFTTSSGPNISMPPLFAADVSLADESRFAPSMQFDEDPSFNTYGLNFSWNTGYVEMSWERAWLMVDGGTNHTLVYPDLTGLPQFKAAWAPPQLSYVNTEACGMFIDDSAGSQLRARAVSQGSLTNLPQ